MNKTVLGMIGAAAAFAAAPGAVSAQTYNVVTGYGAAPFSYGLGLNGTSFTAYTNSFSGGCAGLATLACKTSAGNALGVPDLPTVGKNTGSSAINAYTVSIPTTALLLHPGASATNQDSILRFTAATAGTYTFNGTVSRLDTTANGNGVLYSLFANGAPVLLGSLLPNPLGPTLSQSISYTGFLAAGQMFSFGVNNNGDVGYDSTGLAATITAVPEPASWALMLLGFGIAGGALRRRRRVTVAYA